MNSIRRALTSERNRLLKLSPSSIIQHQHASSSTTDRIRLRNLKVSKTNSPATPPPSNTNPSLNDTVLKQPVSWPRPSEIPKQAKVVNSVNLIGRVKMPVQFKESAVDGKCWAGTILTQDDASEPSTSPTSFWIPLIFEGDMAHIALCHLKENDYVHVAGHLSVDVPPFKLSEVQANVQVMAQSINFVQKSQSKKPDFISMQQDALSKKNTIDVASEKENYAESLNDAKSSPVHNSKETRHLHSDHKHQASWRDLLTNPEQWSDNREKKSKGLVKPKYPDFKHKDTGVGLWLNQAPVEVLQGVGQLGFSGPPNRDLSNKGEKVKDDDPWKHLVEDPDRWWDNRADKKNPKGPDFKNRDSGKALWLTDAPSWVSSCLPPLKAQTVDVNTKNKWTTY